MQCCELGVCKGSQSKADHMYPGHVEPYLHSKLWLFLSVKWEAFHCFVQRDNMV